MYSDKKIHLHTQILENLKLFLALLYYFFNITVFIAIS